MNSKSYKCMIIVFEMHKQNNKFVIAVVHALIDVCSPYLGWWLERRLLCLNSYWQLGFKKYLEAETGIQEHLSCVNMQSCIEQISLGGFCFFILLNHFP